MATSNVLLLKPVENLGSEGEQVTVRAGYARNYLLPKKLAAPVTRANRKQIEALQKAREIREARELESAQATAGQLETLIIALAVKTGEGGKMFGAVTANDIYEKIAQAGVEIERKRVQLPQPVKELGKHSLTIKLHPDVSVEIPFEIVSENPIEEETGE